MEVTEEVIFELMFFKENWEDLDGCPIKPDKSRLVVSGKKTEVASDASAVGIFVVLLMSLHTARGLSPWHLRRQAR